MKKSQMLLSIVWIVLGVGLNVATMIADLNAYWSSVGTCFLAIGVIRLVRWERYRRDEEYRKQIDIEVNDERNRYIRAKAWAWTGYLFVIICAVASITFRIAGQTLLGVVTGIGIALFVLLYWICYLILRKKY